MSVYYVLAPDLDLVKIGFAENPKARFGKIQSDSPARLLLVAIEDGGEAAEAARHEQFAEYRHRGEWFRYSGDLVAHIKSIPRAAALEPREPSLNARIMALGVSQSHASQIVTGKQGPSLSLAIAIWRATGWKCHRIAHVTDADLETIEQVDPWTPPKRQDEAA